MLRSLALYSSLVVASCRGEASTPRVPSPPAAPTLPDQGAPRDVAVARDVEASGIPCHAYRRAGLLDVATAERVRLCTAAGHCVVRWRARDGSMSAHGGVDDVAAAWTRFDERSLRPSRHYADMPDLRSRGVRVRTAPVESIEPVDFVAELEQASPSAGLSPWETYLLVCWAYQQRQDARASALEAVAAHETRDAAFVVAELAQVIIEQAERDLLQGVPRVRVAEMLDRAQQHIGRPEVTEMLEQIRHDGPALVSLDEPSHWASALQDDSIFPGRRLELALDGSRPAWFDTHVPASPAWELVRLGWRSLPVLIERLDDPQPRRWRSGRRLERVGDTVLDVVEVITGADFGTDSLRRWWTGARAMSEWEARIGLIEAPHFSDHIALANARALLALDERRARLELRSLSARLPPDKRRALEDALHAKGDDR
jgi:hypothetical protein